MPRGIAKAAPSSIDRLSSSGDGTSSVDRAPSKQKDADGHLAGIQSRFKGMRARTLGGQKHREEKQDLPAGKDRISELPELVKRMIVEQVGIADPAALPALAATSKSWRTFIAEDPRFELPDAIAAELTGNDPQKLKDLKNELRIEADAVEHIAGNPWFRHKLILAAKAAVMNASPFKQLHDGLSRSQRAAKAIGLKADPLLKFEKGWMGFLPRPEREAVFAARLNKYKKTGAVVHLRELVEQSGVLNADQHQRMLDAAKSTGRHPYVEDDVALLLDGMAFFTEKQRWTIVKHVIAQACDDMPLPNDGLLGLVARQMMHLNREQRSYVFNEVNKIGDERARAIGLSALESGAPHLTGEQCDEALDALLGFHDKWRPQRVASFAGRMPGLSEGQCDRIFDVCIGTVSEEDQVDILKHLAPVLKHCNEAQAWRLLAAALNMEDVKLKLQVLAGFGAEMASFNEEQRATILAVIFGVSDPAVRALFDGDEELQIKTLGGFCTGMEHYDEEQRSSLAKAIFGAIDKLGIDYVVGEAEVAMLAEQAEYLTDDEQKHLVSLALIMPQALRALGPVMMHVDENLVWDIVNDATDLTDGYRATQALRNIAPAFPHLSREQRGLIVTAITRIPHEESRASVLEHFGSTVPHLSPDQWRRIFESAQAIQNPKLRAQALTGLALRDAA